MDIHVAKIELIKLIAATAHAADAPHVTTDTDFDHLKNEFINIDWIGIQAFIKKR